MSSVLSFAEESCWDGETFRAVRRPVIFVLEVTIPKIGFVRHEFTSDFGVFFDPDDDWLIDILERELSYPVDWGRLVYFKKIDHSAIELIDPDNDVVIGKIYPRGSRRQNLSGDDLPEGVTSIAQWRKKHEQRSESEDCTAS